MGRRKKKQKQKGEGDSQKLSVEENAQQNFFLRSIKF